MNLKFWKRQPRIPIETQTELIDLRAKVAEYAGRYTQLEMKHNLFVGLWLHWLNGDKTLDKQIADNMKAYWKESADGAER